MMEHDRIFIRDMLVDCVIGTNPEERLTKRQLRINLELFVSTEPAAAHDNLRYAVDYFAVEKAVYQLISDSSRQLLEALASDIAAKCNSFPGVLAVSVEIEKCGTLAHSRAAALRIFRAKEALWV
ncbi:MAG: dihydroneopterin aldolase [Victivallaceae bacterium]|nr:dihydroneopterin aldolase [Victivallaceae bacterium]